MAFDLTDSEHDKLSHYICPFLPETGERRERRCPWFSYLLIRKLIYSLVPNDTLYGRLTHKKRIII